MKYYLCRVAYLGWYFHGTNVQPDVVTIEGEMEKALNGRVRFLSRTDRGVSALSNYALCYTETNPMKANNIDNLWVLGYREIDSHPKVEYRWYRYVYPQKVYISSETLSLFRGKKDFASFAYEKDRKDTVKEILDIKVFHHCDYTIFDIIGKSFLRQMVRRVVNGIILHEKGVINAEKLFEHPEPASVPPLPPEGLILMDIKLYPDVEVSRNVVNTMMKKLRKAFFDYSVRKGILLSMVSGDI